MELKKVTKRTFDGSKVFHCSHNTESILYVKNDEILKQLKKEFQNRKETVLLLEHLSCDNLVLPEYGLMDKDKFWGYSMHYYKDYITLTNMMKNKTIPFEERKKICYKLCEIMRKMESQNFAYYDLHSNNVLYKDGDIKLIDLDSGEFKPNTNLSNCSSCSFYNTYNTYLRFGNYMLARLCLALLHNQLLGENTKKLQENSSEILNVIPNNLKKLYEYVIDKDGSFLYPEDYLDLITPSTIEETKLILK